MDEDEAARQQLLFLSPAEAGGHLGKTSRLRPEQHLPDTRGDTGETQTPEPVKRLMLEGIHIKTA